MELYTWQGKNHSLVAGPPIDPRKSSYSDGSVTDYPEKCANLFELLGEDQVIWCFNSRWGTCYAEECSLIEWELDIPESKVLAAISSNHWKEIIENRKQIEHVGRDELIWTPDRAAESGATPLLKYPIDESWVTEVHEWKPGNIRKQYEGHRPSHGDGAYVIREIPKSEWSKWPE